MSIYNISDNGGFQTVQDPAEARKHPTANADSDQISKKQIAPLYDEYHPEAGEENQPIGLYHPLSDGKNGLRIAFDAPDPHSAENDPADLKGENPGKNETAANASHAEATSCTVNTDKVDRETEHLKEKKKQLENQLRSASEPENIRELERKLSQVEQELQQKDNDTYRRQHADIS